MSCLHFSLKSLSNNHTVESSFSFTLLYVLEYVLEHVLNHTNCFGHLRSFSGGRSVVRYEHESS